jgi:hypothetical protein
VSCIASRAIRNSRGFFPGVLRDARRGVVRDEIVDDDWRLGCLASGLAGRAFPRCAGSAGLMTILVAIDIDTPGRDVDLEAHEADFAKMEPRAQQAEETGLTGERPDADQRRQARVGLEMDDHAVAGDAQPREHRDAQRLHVDRPSSRARRTRRPKVASSSLRKT